MTADPHPRRVTMSDVARHAGVSRTSVSFVLNNRADTHIPPHTQARIHAAATELGYRPNAGARALAARRSESYGLISEIVTEPYALDVIKGAQRRAWADGRFLLIAAGEGNGGGASTAPDAPDDPTTAPPARDTVAFEKLLEQRPGGLLYATASHRVVRLPPAAYEVPTVLIHCQDAERRLPSVLPDEEAGGRRATQRLLDAGHQRVGLVNLAATMTAAANRQRGYEQALRAGGHHIDDALIVTGGTTAEDGYLAARTLLDLDDPPTALFCANDRMAMGAYDAAKERGLRVPHDLAVVGFDNQELIAAYLRPPLTTVALPFEEMGVRGVELLARLAEGEPVDSPHLVLDCPLVERASV